jgi:hypothetical protein
MEELTIWDKKMLQLPNLLKEADIIKFKQEFYEVIGIDRQYIRGIKKGIRHFTAEQIGRTCKAYGIRADWIFGLTSAMFIRSRVKSS